MTAFKYRRVSRPEHVMFSDMGDESILLNLKTESYHGLDDVGNEMWKALLSSPDVQAAWTALCQQYDAPEDAIRRDLDAFVEHLVTLDLLNGHVE